MFLGSVLHQLDTKNRIRIPKKFKSELGADIALVKGIGEISVYPRKVIENRITELYAKVNPYRKEEMDALTQYLSGIEFPTEDAQGRILIDKKLLEAANIDKDVITIGVIDHLIIKSATSVSEGDGKSTEAMMATLANMFERQ